VDHLLGTPLATIDILFLEQLQSIKEWNGNFLKLFQWREGVEARNHLHTALLNDTQLFYRKPMANEISIYQNPFNLKPTSKKQLLIIFTENESVVESEMKNYSAFLTQQKIPNRLIEVTDKKKLGNYTTLLSMIELEL